MLGSIHTTPSKKVPYVRLALGKRPKWHLGRFILRNHFMLQMPNWLAVWFFSSLLVTTVVCPQVSVHRVSQMISWEKFIVR